jgi:flavin reductase (DIM6/NTAB) family NADH-FMN oxidoreductase RutF
VTLPDADPAVFRQLLGRFASGVTVVTTRDREGRPVGMTASSLASVSMTPPLISVCVDVSAELHNALAASGEFVVNILRADQEAISRRFAELPQGRRFVTGGWRVAERDSIVLDGVLAHIDCEHYAEFPLGDHTLFVGRVTGGSAHEGDPLLYFRGRYGAFRDP